jgi:hypothetical protein
MRTVWEIATKGLGPTAVEGHGGLAINPAIVDSVSYRAAALADERERRRGDFLRRSDSPATDGTLTSALMPQRRKVQASGLG